jgi:hypothetical protein
MKALRSAARFAPRLFIPTTIPNGPMGSALAGAIIAVDRVLDVGDQLPASGACAAAGDTRTPRTAVQTATQRPGQA